MLIEQSIAKQYGILPAAQGELGWAEWVKLVGGLMDDTPLGRVVAVLQRERREPCAQYAAMAETAAYGVGGVPCKEGCDAHGRGGGAK